MEGYTPNLLQKIGKIIAFGLNRPEAIARMQRALKEIEIEGIKILLLCTIKLCLTKNFTKEA
jgi:biotin carboxylase